MGEGKSRIYKELKEKAKQAKKIAGKALRYPLKSKANIDESNEGDEGGDEEQPKRSKKKVRRALKITKKP